MVIPLSNGLALEIGNKDIQSNTQKPMQQNNKEKRMATPGHQAPNDSTEDGAVNLGRGFANRQEASV